MKTAKKIVLMYKGSNSIPEQIINRIRDKTPAGFSLLISDNHTSELERRTMIEGAEYIINYSVPFDDFDKATSLRFVQLLSAGADLLDLERFKQMDIPVANNGSVNAPTVAEHTILLMLSLLKKLPEHHNSMKNKEWLGHQHALNLGELCGKTVGIIGFGHIGQRVARAIKAFNGQVVYTDRHHASEKVEQEFDAKWLPLNELLQTSDIITFHIPLFESTRNMIDKAQFSLMKPTALLINTARGPIINRAALLEALNNHTIAGAGLDAFHNEPLPADDELRNKDNVILTPHIAGTSIDNWERRIDFAFANILDVENGYRPHSIINR
ncbi:NAD(P)-dependent oxidoreductase [Vibrio nitrifigilis]|uniref:Lactate dehydrogenase n=1 Tax=Vibrio nitrifigilis TaxID=2789781 RepID=A0ABS0GIE6_9VIBR|nr:NAD(P)-dependent oxidoreductase [Vibrio nitrifigilis]MBF9002112.1 lactate dehydrogenase [Vibrio nitrifigilis]